MPRPYPPDAPARAGSDTWLLVDLLPQLVWTATSDGRIVRVNRAGADYTGLVPEPPDRPSWLALIHPQDAVQARRCWREAGRTASPVVCECRLRRSDGGFRWHALHAAPFTDGEGRTGWLVAATDVDEARRLRPAERELARAFERLRQANAERQRLLDRLATAQEEERRRIARDVHDDPVQVLAALALHLELVDRATDDRDVQDRLAIAKETVRQAISSLRQLIFTLRPPALDQHGLAHALRLELEQIRSEAGLRVALDDRLDEEPPPHVSATAYRIAAEALLNVRKHARAQQVRVAVESCDEGLLVTVEDDGCGFEERPPEPGHIGLASMREQAELLGGRVRVTSAPRQGTIVECLLPVAREAAA